jgi:hypothetical protein
LISLLMFADMLVMAFRVVVVIENGRPLGSRGDIRQTVAYAIRTIRAAGNLPDDPFLDAPGVID